MSTFTVHLTHVVSTSRTVEADDQNAAVDAAFDAGLPTPGNRIGDEYDAAGEWEASSVEDENGAEVWSEHAERAALARAEREHLAAVEAERDRLRVVAAAARAYVVESRPDADVIDAAYARLVEAVEDVQPDGSAPSR